MSIEENNYELERERRRARMKEEKRKQQRRRALIKKFAPVLIGVVALLVLLIVLLVSGIKLLVKSAGDKPSKSKDTEVEVAEGFKALPINMPGVINDAIAQLPPRTLTIAGFDDVTTPAATLKPGYDLDDSHATSAISEEDVASQFVTLINATTGEVIVSRNGMDRMNPASMTKVMTVLVAVDHITNYDDMWTVTTEDTDFAYRNDLSPAGFLDGETVPIKDILYGAILPSGGECCHAIERYVADSEEEFIQMMNDKAAELGLVNTHFTNSAGLYNEEHYTTVYEMSMIMKAAIENDVLRQILHEHTYVTTATNEHPEGLEISNWFLRRIEDKYDKTEVMGAKTGYVMKAGNCATSYTFDSNGQVYICTTGNAYNYWRCLFDHVYLYNTYVN